MADDQRHDCEDLDASRARDHDVLGLEIVLNDSGLVCGGQRVGDLRREIEQSLEWHRAAAGFPLAAACHQ